MKKTGAQIVAECLLEQGVDTAFGYPGGNVINLYDALFEYSDRIKHILTAHEQGAAHAADGYARTTGKTGVVFATSGPGATNLVTGLANAFMDSIPVVAITGNVTSSQLGRDTFQEIDIFGVTMPVTKHNFIVKNVKDLAKVLRKAFYIAASGRPGPVLVDILKDVFIATTDFETEKPKTIEPYTEKVREEDIDECVSMIEMSKRPMIMAGGGIILSNASKELYEFVKKVDSPVTQTIMGLGSFPADDPYYTGLTGMHGSKASALAVNNCDLLIAIGARFSDRVISSAAHFAKRAKIVHIDVDAAEINKNIKTHHSIVGDAKYVLEKLNSKLSPRKHTEWVNEVLEWKKQYPHIEGAENVVSPQYVIETVHDLVGDDAIIATDVGQHQIWTAQCYPFKKPRTFVTSGGLGTMGFGLGAAIGSQIGNPDKRVVLFTGDGSFHMNLNELVTANMNGLPIVIIVMNNHVLGMVRQWQKLFFDKRFSQTTLDRKTDYVKLSEAFGGVGYVIDKKEDVKPVLKKALECKVPVVIDCRIDRDVNVLPMVPSGRPIDEQVTSLD
ncbi:MAG: biosynthetic-type acetolactate synthase large subunit [Bacillota bacterium]|nr:biosynthetic-type acetolactate synthase large subunit [Bacillota bacterium]